ncbi:MAG TPA: RluA family pseudouridine synthase [Thermoanaerobaculia bacterium]|nr:RluA family pseudouridine synthase [Thermoanaerobaculia bacterium]
MASNFPPSVRLVALPTQAGLRLDQFLAEATRLSRRRARVLAGEGRVLRDGKVARILSRAVEAGTVVDLVGIEEDLGVPARPELPPVVIVHEDPWLVVVDKPAGVLSQPSEERALGELAADERLLLHLAVREDRPPFLRLVHRLDRATSGLLLFARSPAATEPLARLWREGKVERRYLAMVEGRPDFETRLVEAPIGRVAGGAWRFEVSPTGKPAATEVRVIEAGERFSRVECRLRSGRTHQVRVHLAHLGHPVAGDRLYGARQPGPTRPLLHAAELALPHPKDGRPLRLVAPVPADFQEGGHGGPPLRQEAQAEGSR